MGDPTTERIEKIVDRRLQLHMAECPSVKAVGDALKELNEGIQRRHEEALAEYHKTEVKLLEGGFRMKEHSGRIAAAETGVRANAGAIRTVQDTIQNTKTGVLLVVIKWLGLVILCGGFGAGTMKLIGG